MARRKKRARWRRRGVPRTLYKLLSALLVTGALFFSLIWFFRVETVEVGGNVRYTDQQVVAASGVSVGDNLYLLNKFEMRDALFAQLPYVGEVSIYRRLPSTLVIEVREQTAAALYLSDGKGWLISSSGRLLEQTDGTEQEGIPVVTGSALLVPKAGETMVLPEAERLRQSKLLELLQALEAQEMLAQTDSVDLQDPSTLQIGYDGRFTVKLRWDADCEEKLKRLSYVVEQLQRNEVGTIDMTVDGTTRFIPKS